MGGISILLISGNRSKENAPSFIKSIPLNVKSIIRSAHYINNRRWNIYSVENLLIKLPEKEYKKTLESFNDIYNKLSISDMEKIDYIDMRIPEKAIIKFKNKI